MKRVPDSKQPAIIGIQGCGCVTLAIARPDLMDRESVKAMDEIRKAGGRVETTTVAKARRRKYFLPSFCPHDPKGW